MYTEIKQKNKAHVWEFWQKLNNSNAENVANTVQSYVDKNASLHVSHPVNNLIGVEAQVTDFWQPLLTSFPGLQRRTDVFLAGHGEWVGAVGFFNGIFSRDWLGIPATGQMTSIRFGEFTAVHKGQIVLTYLLIDVLDVIRQAGFQLVPPSLGEEGRVAGPMTGDGVLLTPHDDIEGAKTLAMAKTMCGYLNTPKCAEYWDQENMMWYGPCGIGTARGYQDFEDKHQKVFNHAFPAYGAERMGCHVVDIGEGNYAGWVGWPSIRATLGGEYLGFPPTGKLIEWRLMDFYRRESDLIIENWVPIDMAYVFLQLGLDVFEELRKQIDQQRAK